MAIFKKLLHNVKNGKKDELFWHGKMMFLSKKCLKKKREDLWVLNFWNEECIYQFLYILLEFKGE